VIPRWLPAAIGGCAGLALVAGIEGGLFLSTGWVAVGSALVALCLGCAVGGVLLIRRFNRLMGSR
jgi:hypothetical protein